MASACDNLPFNAASSFSSALILVSLASYLFFRPRNLFNADKAPASLDLRHSLIIDAYSPSRRRIAPLSEEDEQWSNSLKVAREGTGGVKG